MSNLAEAKKEQAEQITCPNCKIRIRFIFDHQHTTKTKLRWSGTDEEFAKTFTVKTDYKFEKHE